MDPSAAAAVQQQLGIDPQQLMQQMMSRPELLTKMQDPEVSRLLGVQLHASHCWRRHAAAAAACVRCASSPLSRLWAPYQASSSWPKHIWHKAPGMHDVSAAALCGD
jgi:hypothetical protein